MTNTRRLTVKKLSGEIEKLKEELKELDALKEKVFKLEKLLKNEYNGGTINSAKLNVRNAMIVLDHLKI